MDRVTPYLIPLRVTDESIRNQVKIYYPRDFRRMRKYVVNVDRSHPKIKGMMNGLENGVKDKFAQVKERLYGCESVEDSRAQRPVSNDLPKFDDLLKLAEKNVKSNGTKKVKFVQQNAETSSFDKVYYIKIIVNVKKLCKYFLIITDHFCFI